jgi:hypothetical protein
LSGIQIGAGTGDGHQDDGERCVFLVNNTYIRPQKQDEATLLLLSAGHERRDKAHLYLYAGSNIPGKVVADSGNIYIENTEIDFLSMRQGRFNCSLANLDLENVKIGQGRWEYADVRQGKWQHVRLGRPIDLNQAKIGTITGHYVEFTDGYPWINGKLEIVDSSRPLKFDKPPVPTLEELGLAQFWKENDFPVENY